MTGLCRFAFALLLALTLAPPAHGFWSKLPRIFKTTDDQPGVATLAPRSTEEIIRAVKASDPDASTGTAVVTRESGQWRIDEINKPASVFLSTDSASGIATVFERFDVILPEEYLDKLQHTTKLLPEGHRFKVLGQNGKLLNAQIRSTETIVEHAKGVYQRWSPGAIDALQAVASARIRRADVDVVSFFDQREVDIVRHLDRSVGDIHHALSPTAVEDWFAELALRRNRILIFIGHVEDQELIMRGIDGAVLARIRIDRIKEAANNSGSGLLLLGCETAQVRVTGFLSPVNVTAVADSLEAIKRGARFDELLSAVAQASPEGLLVTRALQNDMMQIVTARSAEALRAERRERGVRLAVVAMRKQPEPVWKTVVATLVGLWLLGVILSVPQWKTVWVEWQDLFPGGKNTYASGLARFFRSALREGVFILLAPYAVIMFWLLEILRIFSLFFLAFVSIYLGASVNPVLLCAFAIIAVVIWVHRLRGYHYFRLRTPVRHLADGFSVFALSLGIPTLVVQGIGWMLSLNMDGSLVAFAAIGLSACLLADRIGQFHRQTKCRPWHIPLVFLYLGFFYIRSPKEMQTTRGRSQAIIERFFED